MIKPEDKPDEIREKLFWTKTSVIANTFLFLLKIIIGFLIASIGVISEGAHSGIDLLAAVIAGSASMGSSASIKLTSLPLPVAANAATAQPMATSASNVLRKRTASRFNLVSFA